MFFQQGDEHIWQEKSTGRYRQLTAGKETIRRNRQFASQKTTSRQPGQFAVGKTRFGSHRQLTFRQKVIRPNWKFFTSKERSTEIDWQKSSWQNRKFNSTQEGSFYGVIARSKAVSILQLPKEFINRSDILSKNAVFVVHSIRLLCLASCLLRRIRSAVLKGRQVLPHYADVTWLAHCMR